MGFFLCKQLLSCIFLRTFLRRSSHSPPPTLALLLSLPAPSSWPSSSCPALSCSCYQIFPSSVFFWTYRIFSLREGKRENFKLTYCIVATLPAMLHSTEHCAQASCLAAAVCMYTTLHKSLQQSQTSMLTLTLTPACGSSCFFCTTSSRCCGMIPAA